MIGVGLLDDVGVDRLNDGGVEGCLAKRNEFGFGTGISCYDLHFILSQ